MEKKSILLGVGVGLLAAGLLYLLSRDTTAIPATSLPTQTYQNDETMLITRNTEGYITKTSIKRDAKAGK